LRIINVVGARPNFMKIAPIIRAMNVYKDQMSHILVHTGQHYDENMSQSFFNDLGLPAPDIDLGVGSGSQAEQTARVMVGFEKVCEDVKPDIVVVVGDVNSTMACAITAKKLNIHVAHIEAGLRSRDMTMPEEINRIVTDSLADWLFVTERSGVANLRAEGKPEDAIHFVGNVMVDNLYHQVAALGATQISFPKLPIPYAVLTLHRPGNVDDETKKREIMGAILVISKDLPVYFPVHPRTKKMMENSGLEKELSGQSVHFLPALPYREFLHLWKDADLVMTDSGGLQEETTALGVPCFTIRENTERPITIEEGTNTLVGTTAEGILTAFEDFKRNGSKRGKIPELWDGRASERIISILVNGHLPLGAY
jgi:UDP-N-acetylglucosamine 2-epimerase (non-hydrolysing)